MRIDRVVESSIGAGIVGAIFVALKLWNNKRAFDHAWSNLQDNWHLEFSSHDPESYKEITGYEDLNSYLRAKYPKGAKRLGIG